MKSVAYAANAKFSFAFKCFSKVLRPFGTPTRYLYHTHPCRNHYIPMHGVEWWASLYIINVPMRLGKGVAFLRRPPSPLILFLFTDATRDISFSIPFRYILTFIVILFTSYKAHSYLDKPSRKVKIQRH